MPKLVLFGDSITAGVHNHVVSPRFSNRIKAQLVAAGTAVELINRGVPGDTSRGGLVRLENDVLAEAPDLVTVFFGTNDVKDPELGPDGFCNQIMEIVTQIGKQKCVVIPPGITGEPAQGHRPNEALTAFATALKATCASHGVAFCDWHPVAAKLGADQLTLADGIHYTDAGYDHLVELLAPLLIEKLKRK